MYVIVAYDAAEDEQNLLRNLMARQLNRVQNSVFAGELRQLEVETLHRSLELIAEMARVQIWVCSNRPRIVMIGDQKDQESAFV